MRKLLVLILALSAVGHAYSATLEEDIAGYVAAFKGEAADHGVLADTFAYAGVSDPRVFDLIEGLLSRDAEAMRNDRAGKNRVARYIRALGFSGQAKYLPTLERFAQHPDYQRFAKMALTDLPNYTKWNPVISNRATFNPKLTDDVNRVMNMLRSDDLGLQRVGAKRVYFANKDDVLLDQLAKNLAANYRQQPADDEVADCIAWMAKGLGSAKQERYRPLLQEVLAGAPSSKVREHAKLALDRYAK